MNRAQRTAAVFLGGAVGGLARAMLVLTLPSLLGWDSAVPLLAVNLGGSLAAGLLAGRLSVHGARSSPRREAIGAGLGTGFLGGFTSYSAFVVGAASPSVLAATLVGCPIAALIGVRTAGGYPVDPTGRPT